MPKNAKQGFTLIELLVVVSIIAVIGAGVAVAYNRLDERAKISMEIADCGTIMRAISQKTALSASSSSSASLPNKLDSLMDSQGKLYTRLSAEATCTFVSAEAPERVVENLAQSGLDKVYLHPDFPESANEEGSAATIAPAALAKEVSELFAAESNGTWWDYETDGAFQVGSKSYSSLREFREALTQAREFQNATTLTRLAFLWSGGGAGSLDQTAGILAQIGLTTEEVASPYEDADEALRDGKTCWLVAFGLGSSATLYDGTGIRIASATESKRYNSDDIYSRYLLLVRVPVSATPEETQVAAVLSPQAMTTAALSALYRSHAEADK